MPPDRVTNGATKRNKMAKKLNIKPISRSKKRSTIPAGESVDVTRSTVIASLFTFWYQGAKACLFPFLTLFFRQLGLSATQTGVVCGSKAIGQLLFSPLWGKCAQRFNKRRFVMMASMFLMIATFLSLTLVPPVDQKESLIFCQHHGNKTEPPSGRTSLSENHIGSNTTRTKAPSGHIKVVPTLAKLSTPSTKKTHSKNNPTATKVSSKEIVSNTKKVTKASELKSTPIVNTKVQVQTTLSVEKTAKPLVVTTAATLVTTEEEMDPQFSKIIELLINNFGMKQEKLEEMSKAEILDLAKSLTNKEIHETTTVSATNTEDEYGKKMDDIYKILEDKFDYSREDLEKMSPKDIQRIINQVKDVSQSQGRRTHHKKHKKHRKHKGRWDNFGDAEDNNDQKTRAKRGVKETLDKITNKLTDLKNELHEKKMLTFIVVLVVLFVGEFFYSPVEKVASAAWHDYLDNIEGLEKFSHVRLWGLIATAIFAAAVALLVDNTQCILQFDVNHFMIHFYSFAGLMAIALLFGFCYPMLGDSRSQYKKRRSVGLCKALFGDCQSTGLTISVFVIGLVTAGINNFLFWQIQDLGGTEIVMGLCISVAAFSELLGTLLCNCIAKLLRPSGVVLLSLAMFISQLVYLSFLWTPWAAVPILGLNCLIYATLWKAIVHNSDYMSDSHTNYDVESHLQTVQNTLGYAVGSFLSGYIYEKFGIAYMYRGGVILLGVWFFLFILIQKCCIKKSERVEYAKLLNGDNDFSDDNESENDIYDQNDWLDNAMKMEKLK